MNPFDIERISQKMAVLFVSAIYPSFCSARLKELRSQRDALLSELALIDLEIKALVSIHSSRESK